MKRIGVFDSGIGGKSVANALQKSFPHAEIIFVSDPKNLPYGTKSPEELKSLVRPKMKELSSKGVDVIVIACNTVSTTILDYVKELVSVPVIGVAPMVEEAVRMSNSKVIAVCATPTTLKSQKYAELKDTYADGVTVFEPDCSRWTQMIEDNNVDRQEIAHRIDSACDAGADVIVLGCTHYHWIEELIKKIAKNRATIIQPEEKVALEVARVFAK